MPHHGEAISVGVMPVLPAYTVYRIAAAYYAINNSTGVIDFTGPDPAVVVQSCLAAGGAGTVVGIREGEFVALTGVAATAINQGVYGMGAGTYWDATALLTNTHAFTIHGITGFHLCEMSIETLAGGGLNNHCVSILNGADDFHLNGLTIIASDTNGIYIVGTTIVQGHIHDCHIMNADEHGILVDMNPGNFIYRLHIEDCDIGNCGGRGIFFDASGGNLYCQIINNIIYSSTDDGIYIINGNYSQLRGNIFYLNGLEGIQIDDTDYIQIKGNISYQNIQYGLLLSGVNYSIITENTLIENDLNDTGSFDGMKIAGSNRNIIKNNHSGLNDRWGIMIDTDSDFNKVGNNYTQGNIAGSIRVNNANCDGNQIEFNTVEEGAPTSVGTLTRSYGNYDPSANAFVGDIGAPPF